MIHDQRMEEIAEQRKQADEERAERRRSEDRDWQQKQAKEQRDWQASESKKGRLVTILVGLGGVILGALLGQLKPAEKRPDIIVMPSTPATTADGEKK